MGFKFLRRPERTAIEEVILTAVADNDVKVNEFKRGYFACYEQICHELRNASPIVIAEMQPVMGAVQRKLRTL